MVTIEAVIIAAIGAGATILAGLFLKLLEHFLGKAKSKADSDSGMRSELRLELERKYKEIAALKVDLAVAEQQADTWRSRYWNIYELFYKIRVAAIRLLAGAGVPTQEIEDYKAPHDPQI